jgi:hypothetical protein
MAGKNNKKGRGTGGSVEARRHANSVAKGLRVPHTEAQVRQFDQNIAREQRRLAELTARPPRNAFGIDRTAAPRAQAQIDGLNAAKARGFNFKDRSGIRQAAKERHLQARLVERNQKFTDSMAAIRAASNRR